MPHVARSSLVIALLAAAPAAHAQRWGEDHHTAPRNAAVNAAGARLVRVRARAGELRVDGVDGIDEARIKGTARASEREELADITLRAERRGDVVEIEVVIPEQRGAQWGNHYRGLDLEIEVPRAVALDVDDGSGSAEFRHVGALDLQDSSGEIVIRDAAGAVRVEDSSGGIEIEGVRGDVTLRDSSGEIEVRDVTGRVTVEDDASGSIYASKVTGTVHVRDDSSGDIEVADVGGDFVVDHDGSGDVRHRGVKGEVRVPLSRAERRAQRRARDRGWQ
jgi:hypothetical protein